MGNGDNVNVFRNKGNVAGGVISVGNNPKITIFGSEEIIDPGRAADLAATLDKIVRELEAHPDWKDLLEPARAAMEEVKSDLPRKGPVLARLNRISAGAATVGVLLVSVKQLADAAIRLLH